MEWFILFLWNRWKNSHMLYGMQRYPPCHAPFFCSFYYKMVFPSRQSLDILLYRSTMKWPRNKASFYICLDYRVENNMKCQHFLVRNCPIMMIVIVMMLLMILLSADDDDDNDESKMRNLSFRTPLSTRPHQNVVWYNNSWLGFQKILNYIPKERGKYTAKNEPSFVHS